MASSGRFFKGNASVMATMQPWYTTPRWQHSGAFLGFEMRTGQVAFIEPQLLKRLEIIYVCTILVLAQIGHGKSALVKSLILRLLALQSGIDASTGLPKEATARMHDRKPNKGRGEYADVSDWLLANTIKLTDQGSINLFDPRMGMTEWDILESAINIAEAITGQRLSEYQTLAAQVAVYTMMRDMSQIASPEILEIKARSLDASDLDRYFARSDSEVLLRYKEKFAANDLLMQQLQLSVERPRTINNQLFLDGAGSFSIIIGKLLRGDYGKLFGGNRSLYELLTEPMVNLDWTGVTGKAGEILEAQMERWDAMALDGGDSKLSPTINASDEVHSAIKSVPHARARDAKLRKGRAYETTEILVSHNEADLTRVGDDNSELRGLGESISRSIGMRFYGRQEESDATLHAITQRGVSDHDAWFLTQLEVGEWGIHVQGQKMRWVRHVLLPSEIPLVQTNVANENVTNRIRVSSLPHIQERLRKLGATTIGVD